MTFILNRFIDIIIAAALMLAVYTFLFVGDENEYEAELNPIDAKVQQYCSKVENDADVPSNVKKACADRQKTIDQEHSIISKTKLTV